ncbi:heavy metal sensor histidine kinase [Piscinibacter koreensis]|uniref:Sensor protein n=1 Tax=Piscinibacter koreensis TaxID=2742824 RepID=A0A7Y6NSB6_9BURK|nr:heavy metal sensor histidine kinase [Schlegelella koreensis]NUZ08438.1 heavy metal sensor histidine kinase [Schlegelella koreensis]
MTEVSLALRVAAASALFGLFTVGLVAAGGYWVLSRELEQRELVELEGKRDLVQHLLLEIGLASDIPANAYHFADLLIAHDDLHLALVDQGDGRLLASFSSIAVESVRLPEGPLGALIRWQASDKDYYVSLSGRSSTGEGQLVRFVLSLDIRDDRRVLAGYARAGMIGLPLLLLLVAIGAWLIARAGLVPLRSFAQRASSITPKTLGKRLPRTGVPAELKGLADAFNAMLERIDEGVTRLSQFSGDLAHEMRTPVATLLGRTQVALSRERSSVELRDVLAGNIDELDRLTRLIHDMLFLAQAEQGAAVLDRTPVGLGEEARRVTEFLSLLAEERRIQVEVSGNALIQADRLLMQRAITNLLTNAIRHADPASTVQVTVERTEAVASLAVSNRGRPIAPDRLDAMFERFVRLDVARARADGGSGLGLAIVRSIMQAHGGSAQVSSSPDGLTVVTLAFPLP